MAKKRERGKLGGMLKKEDGKSPSADDLKKMLSETEGKSPLTVKKAKKSKVKIGTQVDKELYEEFRTIVKERGMKLGFIVESMMKHFIEENSRKNNI